MIKITDKLDKWADSLTQEQFNNRVYFVLWTIIVGVLIFYIHNEITTTIIGA